MADEKLTDLPALPTPLTTGDAIYVVRSSTDYQGAFSDLPQGTVTSVTSANSDIGVATTTTTPFLTLATVRPTIGGTGITTYAAGDILYASASNTLAKLAKGNNGEVLTLTLGLPSWTAAGAGNVTSAGTLTSNALVIGQGTTAVAVTTTGTGVLTALGINIGSAGAMVVNGGVLGTPSSGTLTNATGLPVASGISGLGTGVATALAINVGSAGATVVLNGALGTPSSGTLTNATGLPVGSGISGLGTGIATALAINVGSAGAPVLFNGAGGTPSSLTLTNATGLPVAGGGTGASTLTANNVILGNGTSAVQFVAPGSSGNVLTSNGTTWASSAPSGGGNVTAGGTLTSNAIVIGQGSAAVATTTTGTGVLTALGINTGSAGAFVVLGGALGTPSSGTLTNTTGLPTGGLLDAAVTLAKMADLAQDQFIGRTTASTGVPQTATITAAARTVLDDTTVGAMVDTLGGATSTGTGGIARATSPTFITPLLGTPTSGVLTNCTGLPIGSLVAGTLVGTMTLAENVTVALDPAGSADGKFTGITITGTSGYSQAFGDLVMLDPNQSPARWELASVSAAAGAVGDCRGLLAMVVVTATDGNTGTLLLQGQIRADANFPALTVNGAVYATTTGDITSTQPSTTDHVIRIVGGALTADEIYFNPDNQWITHT